MANPTFVRLNDGWNAEPNAPDPRVVAGASTVSLSFLLNPWAYKADEEEVGILSFGDCRSWRLGATNDEGWYSGQCRYSAIAPAWGEFYEIVGPDLVAEQPDDWRAVSILTTRLIFLPSRSCADSRRFLTRSGNFRDERASWRWKRRNCVMADG